MSDDDNKGNVVPFPTRLRVAPLVSMTKPEPTCFPHSIQVDGTNRTVVCGKCAKPFTPWDALMLFVKSWEHYEVNRKSIKASIEDMQRQRDELKKEIKSLRAKQQRLERKAT